MDEECELFSKAKVQPQSVAQRLLDLCQFQSGVAYKNFAYKKSV